MSHRRRAYLAAGWAIVFALPHLWWATGAKDGLGTALSDSIVAESGVGIALLCAAIAVFCLCGAAVALATLVDQPVMLRCNVRRMLGGLVWFGAALLVIRSVDIYVEFSLSLTDLQRVPAEQRENFLHLARWYLFGYGPWFALGAVAWTRLAWRCSRPERSGRRLRHLPTATVGSDAKHSSKGGGHGPVGAS